MNGIHFQMSVNELFSFVYIQCLECTIIDVCVPDQSTVGFKVKLLALGKQKTIRKQNKARVINSLIVSV